VSTSVTYLPAAAELTLSMTRISGSGNSGILEPFPMATVMDFALQLPISVVHFEKYFVYI